MSGTPNCPHCDPAHTDPRSHPWGVYVGPERDGDGQPTTLHIKPSDGAHVADSDAAWLWELIRTHGVSPGEREMAEIPMPPKEWLAELTAATDKAAAGYGWQAGYAAAVAELQPKIISEHASYQASEHGELRDQIAKTATQWALIYPLANWGVLGCVGEDGREQLRAIARDIARAWGEDIADKVMAVVEPRLSEAMAEAEQLREQMAALMDPRGAEQIEKIQAERDAMPEDERRRLDAAAAPLLRIQLAAMLRQRDEAKVELDKTADAAASEIWAKAGFNAINHWRGRAERAEAAIGRAKIHADRLRDWLADDKASITIAGSIVGDLLATLNPAGGSEEKEDPNGR